MAYFRTLFLLSLLFAVVLVISARASADNELGVARTQGGVQGDRHGGRRWHGGGGGHHCHYLHCKEGVHRDETHQTKTETETKSGETVSTNTNDNGDRHKPYKPYKPKPKHCKHWPHCH
ncbi:Hypothetical predicted protein [Olea europaea subsp. europaea]|uniref:Uncharacterized protein n=1 Tax=Olea europaea subsp. europaea TaxID=158383 RepID=A0A8S0TGK1_OLEEU|nr:Hypothetical predicted protein [Olea europaea subsp. europaea]